MSVTTDPIAAACRSAARADRKQAKREQERHVAEDEGRFAAAARAERRSPYRRLELDAAWLAGYDDEIDARRALESWTPADPIVVQSALAACRAALRGKR